MVRWLGYLARVRMYNGNSLGKPEGKRAVEDLDVDGRIILKVDLKEVGISTVQ
jgi:hypothetical protein